MSSIDDMLEDAESRSILVEFAKGCESALLLFYDAETGYVRSSSFGLTGATKSFLLTVANASFADDLMREDDDR